MHRHPILSTALIGVGTLAVYGAFLLLAHLVFVLGWYAGAPS